MRPIGGTRRTAKVTMPSGPMTPATGRGHCEPRISLYFLPRRQWRRADFDLRHDPDEQNNLAADPGHAALRQSLRDALLEKIVLQDYPKTRRSLFALGVH